MKNAFRLALILLVPALGLLAVGLAGEEQVYGAGLTDGTSVALVDLLRDPETFVGKKVRVEGRVRDVCPRRGCWIEIESSDGERSVRFKVQDGVIVFPMEAKGRPVTAEGTFTRMELTQEQAVGYLEHMAEERGEPFDPAEVKGALTVYQIRGEGAVIR